jgi:tetratricopeptide (TPR) repeat protein
MKKSLRIWALGFGLILLVSGLSIGQQEEEEQARLEGKIMDVEKKPLAEAEIQFKNMATGQVMTVKSNKKGDFFVRTLFPGKYLLTASKEGYVSHSVEVELQPGSSQRLTINLAKGLTAEQKNQKEAFESFQKGVQLANEKKLEEATAAFRTATELNPTFAEAYINLGMLLFQQMKDDEAEKALLKALELKPDEPKTKSALGNLYFEKARTLLEADKTDEALEQLKTSYSYNPDYSFTNYLLGYAHSKKGNKEEAIKYFEAFLAKEPNSPQAAQVKEILENLKKQ